MTIHELKIADTKAREAFEYLLGFKIQADIVRLPHDVYVQHAAGIQAIQMGSAFRLKS